MGDLNKNKYSQQNLIPKGKLVKWLANRFVLRRAVRGDSCSMRQFQDKQKTRSVLLLDPVISATGVPRASWLQTITDWCIASIANQATMP